MKISKFVLTILIAVSLFVASATKASAYSSDRDQNKNNDNNKGGGGGVCLPINGQVWFLLVAGAAIGTWVIVNKSKETAVKTVPVRS